MNNISCSENRIYKSLGRQENCSETSRTSVSLETCCIPAGEKWSQGNPETPPQEPNLWNGHTEIEEKEVKIAQRLDSAKSICQALKEKSLLLAGKLHLVLPEQVTFTVTAYQRGRTGRERDELP